MRRLLNKSSLAFFAKIVGLTLLIFGVYYLLYSRPIILLSRALTASEVRLLAQRNQLLVSRVALTGFTRLSPTSANLGQEMEDLLSRLRQSNTDGLSMTENGLHASPVSGPSRPALEFYNEHLLPAETDLSAKMKTLLSERQPVVDQLLETHRVIKNIFLYPPREDIGLRVKTTDEANRMIARVEDAKVGLATITTSVSLFPASEAKTTLEKSLRETQNSLDALLRQLRRRSWSGITWAQGGTIEKFFALKQAAIDYLLSLIRSPETVALLTRQTNLMLEYDFWIKNIERHQRALFSATQL